METKLVWSSKLEDKDKGDFCIWDICYSPYGESLVVAAGTKVLVYESGEGKLLQQLKGHKEAVVCVAYASDGKRFASGSLDKLVIIWSSEEMKGILKYTHNDAIQSLSFNPVSTHLASCACMDFGLWSVEQKNVNKRKVSARITSSSWTSDGQYLALGMYNGTISIVNKSGDEKMKIERPSGALSPVWSLDWNPSKAEQNDTLAVVDWSQKLAFYHLSGKQIQKDRSLGFDPCRVTWFPFGDYLLISGSDKQTTVYTSEGVLLGTVSHSDAWIWSCRIRAIASDGSSLVNYNNKSAGSGGNIGAYLVAVGSQSGSLEMHRLEFSTVQAIYRDRYTYREGMTDVIVQNLSTNEKVRIKCRQVVLKVAIYKHKFGVLLPDRLLIYEANPDDLNDMHYRIKEKLNKAIDCHIMILTANHILFGKDNKLQCLNFQGIREREWLMDSDIRQVKVIGGQSSQEGLLVGLKNGQIMQIFINNAFPVGLLSLTAHGVKSCDLSCDRKQVAVIDDHNTLHVFDVQTKVQLYEEPNAHSVVWNAAIPELLCFTGNDMLSIKAGTFPPRTQHMKGLVVGYVGSRVHCLQGQRVQSVEVPQSTAMFQYLEHRRYPEAYRIACEGVSWSDWRTLAMAALNDLELQVARRAFERLEDYEHLRLVSTLEDRQRRLGGVSGHFGNAEILPQLIGSERDISIGDILAHEGQFAEAAKAYRRAQSDERAMNMYSALRQFDNAKEFAGTSAPEDKKRLIAQQADWASNTNDKKAAAQMYLEAGEITKAITVMGECGWTEMLIDVARKLEDSERDNLEGCALYLHRLGQYPYAAECYTRIGQIETVIQLHVDAKHWEEAFLLVKKHPEYKAAVYKPYAQYLAENDKFEEAQAAFHEAGLQTEAVHVLQQLTENAVNENRFNDAGYYYWKVSMQCLQIAQLDKMKRKEMLIKFRQLQQMADIYYVYYSIQRYTDEPFSSHMPEALFNMSRYLIQIIGNDLPPPGVSKVNILYTLAKQSRNLGAYKLARFAYEQLQNLRIPPRFREAVDVGAITVRGTAYNDVEDVLPMCYKCSNTNPLLNKEGDCCINCKEKFVHSFVSFDILPMVEFFLEEGITDNEALELIAFDPAPKGPKKAPLTASSQWKENNASQSQSLRLDLNGSNTQVEDPFNAKLAALEFSSGNYIALVLDRDTIKAIPSSEIVVLKRPPPFRYQYYKNIMPDVSITKCNTCLKLFHTDDYELQALQLGHCPFCRTSVSE